MKHDVLIGLIWCDAVMARRSNTPYHDISNQSIGIKDVQNNGLERWWNRRIYKSLHKVKV